MIPARTLLVWLAMFAVVSSVGCAIALAPDSHRFELLDAFGDAAFEVVPSGGVRRTGAMG